MQYDNKSKNYIKICLEDSIFKNHQQSESFGHKNFNQKNILDYAHPLSDTFLAEEHPQILSIDYLNGRYFGKVNNKKQPLGSGVIIDDKFNFFLSIWKQKITMNGLTLVKLFSGTQIYGSWIQGKMNGWNVIKINQTQIFMDIKNEHIVESPILVLNRKRAIAYLIQVHLQQTFQFKLKPKIQIINRKQIKKQQQRSNQNTTINLMEVFASFFDIKIPKFLFSISSFIDHLCQHVEAFETKKVQINSQSHIFLSIKDSFKQQCERFPKRKRFFVPFQQFMPSKQQIFKKKLKKLGIVYNSNTGKTASLGQYNNQAQLSGLGICFPNKNSQILFGLFKSNMLIHQFEHGPLLNKNVLNSQALKNQLTQYHMKSINFVKDYIYFGQVEQAIRISKDIQDFVNIFQLQYGQSYASDKESFTQSEEEFQQFKYENLKLLEEKTNEIKIKNNKDRSQKIAFIKRNVQKQIESFPSIALRPYGKVVKSRSPLRKLKTHSHSKSPSEIETHRKVDQLKIKVEDSYYKKHQKLQIAQGYNSKYNQKTEKNKNVRKNMNSRFFQQKNQQNQRDQDLINTRRVRNECQVGQGSAKNMIKESYQQNYKGNGKHLRENYFKGLNGNQTIL